MLPTASGRDRRRGSNRQISGRTGIGGAAGKLGHTRPGWSRRSDRCVRIGAALRAVGAWNYSLDVRATTEGHGGAAIGFVPAGAGER